MSSPCVATDPREPLRVMAPDMPAALTRVSHSGEPAWGLVDCLSKREGDAYCPSLTPLAIRWFPGFRRAHFARGESPGPLPGNRVRYIHSMSSNAKSFYVYMTASKPRGVLYTGLTSDLAGRAWEHRARVVEGFTTRYWAGRLVYFERHDHADTAQRREYLMKRWRRDWKIKLVEDKNPTWRDLYNDVLVEFGFEP